jgi:hypothetical protein
MPAHARPVIFLLLLVLALSLTPLTSATTISVRGHSNYGQGGPSEQIGATQVLTLSDGTVLNAQAECPTGGPAANGNGICDLMFVYTITSLGSSASNLTVSFSGLSNFNFNGQALQGALDFNGVTYGNTFDFAPYGFLGTDAPNVSSLPGLDPLAITATGSATGGPGSISFTITNAQVGLSFFFIDTATTQVCDFGDTFDCSDLNPDLASIPLPQGTASTPEPASALLLLTGLGVTALAFKRNR